MFVVVAVIVGFAFANTDVKGTTLLTLGGMVMCLAIVGLSLVLLTGYSGQVSLCQFSFMGIGAFVMGKVAGGGSVLGLVAAIAICAGIGALVALPTIRLSDLYLALATFAFADAVATGFFADGRIYGSGGLPIGRIVLPGLSFGGDTAEFLLVTVFFVLSALLVLAIRRSLFGRRLVAVNDSPAAYATVGLDIGFTKVAVFAMAAGMAGLAGALYGTVQGIVGHHRLRHLPGHHLRAVRDHLEHPHRVGGLHGGAHLRGPQPGVAVAASGSSPASASSSSAGPPTASSASRRSTSGSRGRRAAGVARRRADAGVQRHGARRGGLPCRRLTRWPRRRRGDGAAAVLTVEGVAVRFGGVAALSDANLTVREGRSPGSSARTAPARRPCST